MPFANLEQIILLWKKSQNQSKNETKISPFNNFMG